MAAGDRKFRERKASASNDAIGPDRDRSPGGAGLATLGSRLWADSAVFSNVVHIGMPAPCHRRPAGALGQFASVISSDSRSRGCVSSNCGQRWHGRR